MELDLGLIAELAACHRFSILSLGFDTFPTGISFARLVKSGSRGMKWNMYGAVILLGLISAARGASSPTGRTSSPPQHPEVMYVVYFPVGEF